MSSYTMSAREHAEALYADMLKSLQRFYAAEHDYDAIVNEVARKRFATDFDNLKPYQQRIVKHDAGNEKLLEDAAGKCLYARDRTAMLAAAYQVTRDWQDRYEKSQSLTQRAHTPR